MPVSVRKRLWFRPTAPDTTLISLKKSNSTGPVCSSQSPHPSCPFSLRPARKGKVVVEPLTTEKTVQSERIAQAISQLPESQAQVVYMSFFEGRSHSEIADRLMIPLGSVKSRIRLAADKLKLALRGEQTLRAEQSSEDELSLGDEQ